MERYGKFVLVYVETRKLFTRKDIVQICYRRTQLKDNAVQVIQNQYNIDPAYNIVRRYTISSVVQNGQLYNNVNNTIILSIVNLADSTIFIQSLIPSLF